MSNQFFFRPEAKYTDLHLGFPLNSMNQCLLKFISIFDKLLFFCNAIYSFQNIFTYMRYRLWKRSYSCKYNFGQKFMTIALQLHCKRILSSQCSFKINITFCCAHLIYKWKSWFKDVWDIPVLMFSSVAQLYRIMCQLPNHKSWVQILLGPRYTFLTIRII